MIDYDLGKALVLNHLEHFVTFRSFGDGRLCNLVPGPEATVERTFGRIVWSMYDTRAPGRHDGVLSYLGPWQLSRAMFPHPAALFRRDTLHLTFTLNYWWTGGGGTRLNRPMPGATLCLQWGLAV